MKKFRSFTKRYGEDLLFLAGLIAILIGTYQLSSIAAWFVGGAECIISGVVLAWSKRK